MNTLTAFLLAAIAVTIFLVLIEAPIRRRQARRVMLLRRIREIEKEGDRFFC